MILLAQLSQGIAELNLEIPSIAQQGMLDFLNFLKKWNAAFNLTAISDLDKMVTHHLLDSLSIAGYIRGSHILDVGTGAGFPGIPLAFCFPEKNFVLLDSNGKKIRFLIQAKAEFNLKNINPVQARVEDYQSDHCFDEIIIRAVGSIQDLIKKSKHLCCKSGQYLFMKGALPEDELTDLEHPYTIHPLKVPYFHGERHLVVVEPQLID
jgi:16S rRNA (guanine527-N7)-methyltransferase